MTPTPQERAALSGLIQPVGASLVGEGADLVLLSAWHKSNVHTFHHLLAFDGTACIHPGSFDDATPQSVLVVRKGLPTYRVFVDTQGHAAIGIVAPSSKDVYTFTAFYPEPVRITPNALKPSQHQALGDAIDALFAARLLGSRLQFHPKGTDHDRSATPSWFPRRPLSHHPTLSGNIRATLRAFGQRLFANRDDPTKLLSSNATTFVVKATLSLPARDVHGGILPSTVDLQTLQVKNNALHPVAVSLARDQDAPLMEACKAHINALDGMERAYVHGLVAQASSALPRRVDIVPLRNPYASLRLPARARTSVTSVLTQASIQVSCALPESITAHTKMQAIHAWETLLSNGASTP